MGVPNPKPVDGVVLPPKTEPEDGVAGAPPNTEPAGVAAVVVGRVEEGVAGFAPPNTDGDALPADEPPKTDPEPLVVMLALPKIEAMVVVAAAVEVTAAAVDLGVPKVLPLPKMLEGVELGVVAAKTLVEVELRVVAAKTPLEVAAVVAVGLVAAEVELPNTEGEAELVVPKTPVVAGLVGVPKVRVTLASPEPKTLAEAELATGLVEVVVATGAGELAAGVVIVDAPDLVVLAPKPLPGADVAPPNEKLGAAAGALEAAGVMVNEGLTSVFSGEEAFGLSPEDGVFPKPVKPLAALEAEVAPNPNELVELVVAVELVEIPNPMEDAGVPPKPPKETAGFETGVTDVDPI